ncbi:hypothetical protein ACFPK5_11110 [Streptomyces beijiangensis]|uniref:hypothetical protein n=1 Tax=Streptomyces beijiangensis TaxID=163361 RepID=UPI0036067607
MLFPQPAQPVVAGVPATAAAVAVATTAATVLAGAATAGLLHSPTGQDPPAPKDTPSETRAP